MGADCLSPLDSPGINLTPPVCLCDYSPAVFTEVLVVKKSYEIKKELMMTEEEERWKSEE